MVHFVGAGPGAPDLITLRGAELMKGTDVVIYAGSLVNPALLGLVDEGCRIYNSAEMTLEQVLDVMREAHGKGLDLVRLHTGDPCLYGAVREQMDRLDVLLLRRGGGAGGGAHPPRGEPDRHHHPHGGPHPGPGAGKSGASGLPRRVHGHLPVRRDAGAGAGGAAGGGRVYGRYPRRHRL